MKWKNLPPIMLIAVPWLLALAFAGNGIQQIADILFRYIFFPVLLLFPIVLILNLYWALFRAPDTGYLALWNLRIKLWLIPVYLFVLIFAIGVPLAIPFLFAFDALLLLTSSCYGLRALVRAKKDAQLRAGMFPVLFVCHFVFILDVIAAILLKKKMKHM